MLFLSLKRWLCSKAIYKADEDKHGQINLKEFENKAMISGIGVKL